MNTAGAYSTTTDTCCWQLVKCSYVVGVQQRTVTVYQSMVRAGNYLHCLSENGTETTLVTPAPLPCCGDITSMLLVITKQKP